MQNFTAAEMGMDTLRACHGRLAGSATAKIGHVPRVWEGLIDAGIPGQAIAPIALLELSCLALFLIPRTSVLGAFLLTGYLGGYPDARRRRRDPRAAFDRGAGGRWGRAFQFQTVRARRPHSRAGGDNDDLSSCFHFPPLCHS